MTLNIMGLLVTLSINDTQLSSIECQYAECRLIVIMLGVVMLNVVTLSVVAPLRVEQTHPQKIDLAGRGQTH
jgi:hypothetical protein